MRSAPLSDILGFRADDVVARFQKQTAFSPTDCETVFTETKRWLWACARRTDDEEAGKQVPPPLLISPELIAIDEMWHCFLSHPEKYNEFCKKFLGRTVRHHQMEKCDLEKFARIRATDPKEALALRQKELKPQLDYLHDLVGPKILKLWYQEFPTLFKILK